MLTLPVVALLMLTPPADGARLEFTMADGARFVVATNPKASPKTVARIVQLVSRGFYDRQRVHRVEPWVVQWGAPESKTLKIDDPKVLSGGSGVRLPFERSDIDFKRGIVGIASDGLQNGGDSQIFVLKSDRLYLYHSYAVLGEIESGLDVVGRIQRGDRIVRARVLEPASRKTATKLHRPTR